MADSRLGLAVFGAGRIGTVHARSVSRHVPGATLVGVADIDRDAAQRLVDDAGMGRVSDAQAFLDDPAVNGVIIATPTDTHSELILRATSAGKHILCEKPISRQLSETKTAEISARWARVILQVGFQRRFDAEFSRARMLVANGDLGQPRFLRLVGRDHRIPSIAYLKTSGGQFADQMVHEFDLARWLMAPLEIEEVYATGSALIEPALEEFGDVDTSLVVLRFSGGALGVIDNSREAIYGYDVRGEIQGSKGMVLVGHQRLDSGDLIDSKFATPDVESFTERFADAYRAEVREFVAAIRERREPLVGARDALEALRIALAADRSMRENRPVKLAEITGDR
ncbi:MAG TPA: inositol 2-dehydrogenase [Candidatus Eremiobacteraceae bacterium]